MLWVRRILFAEQGTFSMSITKSISGRRSGRVAILALLPTLVVLFGVANWAAAQQTDSTVVGFGYSRAVGGISINSDGLLERAGVDAQGKLSKLRAEAMHKVPADLNEATPLRKVSLRRLNAAIEEAMKTGKNLPDEVVFLAGLQEIRYVFVYPEQKDIVLVGPAEGWKVDGRGNIVGVTTGKPVMHLDDFLVALRAAMSPGQAGVTCSIDPAKERLEQLRVRLGKLRAGDQPAAVAAESERILGRQQISFTGVPATSRFAAVLVGADYQMKRIAMNFEPSPVRGLKSFLEMMGRSRGGMSNIMPRWWLEPTYESVLRDPSGNAWELDGSAVKCMTEEDFVTASGNREHKGKANPLAQKWADDMTTHYAQLAVAEPVFGELRNCMELAVVASLIARENLIQKAGCEASMLTSSAQLKTAEFPAPTEVDSKSSVMKKSHGWTITVSGGVAIRPWEILATAKDSKEPAVAREKAMPDTTGKWYWN